MGTIKVPEQKTIVLSVFMPNDYRSIVLVSELTEASDSVAREVVETLVSSTVDAAGETQTEPVDPVTV